MIWKDCGKRLRRFNEIEMSKSIDATLFDGVDAFFDANFFRLDNYLKRK